jgi:hypothetical protein
MKDLSSKQLQKIQTKPNKKTRPKKTSHLIVQESKHQEDQGWKAIQGNSLPNSISKIPEKTT